MAYQFGKKIQQRQKRVKEVIEFVKNHKGLEYATTKMKEFQQKALNILDEFPTSPYKEALTLMVNYVIDRKI